MEKKYYMIIDGNQAGPFSVHEMLGNGLNMNTMVWTAGLSGWVPAGEVPELMSAFNNSQFGQNPYRQDYGYGSRQPGGFQQPGYGQPGYNNGYNQGEYKQPYNRNGFSEPRANWMTPAIIATVLGFLCSCIGMIFGILAINNASKANKAYAMGDDAMGDHFNSSAKTYTIVAYVIAGIGLILSIGMLSSIF